MPKPVVGGYLYRQTITKAINSNRAARECLRRLIDDKPAPQAQAILVARAANALGDNLEALRELEQICSSKPEGSQKV